MTEETEISIPAEVSETDTSDNADEPAENTDTSSAQEPVNDDTAAETETDNTDKPRLYANKYKNVDELEKGYLEVQKTIAKNSEFEKKYNELLRQQEQQQEQQRLEAVRQANRRGFRTQEEAEIADRVTIAEYKYYADNINSLAPESVQDVTNLLANYYNTGNRTYLEEAKRYYSSDFIENVALAKQNLANELIGKYSQYRSMQKTKEEEKLAGSLKENFGGFLEDLNANGGKSQALKAFCNAGFINSVEDMQTFQNIYSEIAKFEREKAIKEYEAQKVVDETKNKAVLPQNAAPEFNIDSGKAPTYAEISKMSQAQYNKAVAKYGLEKILQAT